MDASAQQRYRNKQSRQDNRPSKKVALDAAPGTEDRALGTESAADPSAAALHKDHHRENGGENDL